MAENMDGRVVMIKNIPHGFYEKEMTDFFSQFGPVTRVKLLRSRKYLNSKGIAFVEFKYDDVAKIAAHTMDNYLMFEKLLKCEVVPTSKLPPGLFKNWRKNKVSSIIVHKSKSGRLREEREWVKLKSKKIRQIRGVEKKLAELGIEFKCKIIEEPVVESDNDENDQQIEDDSDEEFASMTNADDTNNESFVSCDSSPLPITLRTYSENRSRSGMKRKLLCIPKFAILRAARRLSL